MGENTWQVLLSHLLFGQLCQCGAIVSLRKYLTIKKNEKRKKRKHRHIFLKYENNNPLAR